MTGSEGTTPSERYLSKICKRAFLSLWSYSNLYRDQLADKTGDGKELADLIVVFGNDIIVFSDKDIAFECASDDIAVTWMRWLRRAITGGMRQLLGARRWLRTHPDRVFVDRLCTKKLPINLPDMSTAHIHLVLVARGAEVACREHFGGSGSLMITNTEFTSEFCVNVTVDGGFVHVLDAVAMDEVLNQLDTVRDFLEYLTRKEELFEQKQVLATGEEELLGFYLTNVNTDNNYSFEAFDNVDAVGIEEGFWRGFLSSKQRQAQLEANKISYAWDRLTEKFIGHIVTRTQYYATTRDVAENEQLPYWMAREKRTRRRMLARKLASMVETARDRHKASVIMPSEPDDPIWVFLVLPEYTEHDYETYRRDRMDGLALHLQIVGHLYPHHKHVCGIATSPLRDGEISEDFLYMDTSLWTDEDRAEAQRAFEDNGIFKETGVTRGIERDYPISAESAQPLNKKIGRNDPCICKSGKKFKKCCMNRIRSGMGGL